MAANASDLTATDDRVLEVSRIIDAPRALVFKAWTDPAHVARWWGPRGFTTTYCNMDIRPGGAYRVCMRAPDGGDHWKQGVFREIVAPERIVFTFAWADADGNPGHQLLTTVSFAEHGAGTMLRLRQEVFETAGGCESHRTGWTSCLQRLADYVATI